MKIITIEEQVLDPGPGRALEERSALAQDDRVHHDPEFVDQSCS